MHRFYLPPDQTRGAEIFLRDAEAHHAVDVLRVRAGERVAVLDGAGQELVCAVESAASGQVKLSVIHRNSLPALPYQITLLQAIPKGKIMESIIQKATELGAH